MNECKWYIPEYLNGSMGTEERKAFETHLSECETCQAEVEEWSLISGVVQAQNETPVVSRDLVETALRQAQTKANSRWNLHYAFTMLRAQISLIRSELWASSFLILMLGIIGARLFERIGVFTMIAPLVAAGCVAAVYGKDNDQAYELMLSTPVSKAQVLLARLVLVFGYNLILFLIGLLVINPLLDSPMTMSVLGQWLAPMTFLSSLALLLSVSIGANQAVLVTYVLWISSQFVQDPMLVPGLSLGLAPLARFMEMTGPLYLFSAVLLLLTLAFVRKPLGLSKQNM